MRKSIEHLPPQFQLYEELRVICELEDKEILLQSKDIEKMTVNNYFKTADATGIEAFEKVLKIQPKGNLEQRRSFLLGLAAASEKLSAKTIQNIVEAITGGKVLVAFYGADETSNPFNGYGYIDIKVLSPALDKDYNFSDVERVLRPKIPTHLKYMVNKSFSAWRDIKKGFKSWEDVQDSFSTWENLSGYKTLETEG